MQLPIAPDALSGCQRGTAEHLAAQLKLPLLSSLTQPEATFNNNNNNYYYLQVLQPILGTY